MFADMLAPAIRFGLYLDLMLLFGCAAFRLHALLSAAPALQPRDGGNAVLFTAIAGLLLSIFGLEVLAANMSGATLGTVDRGAVELLLYQTSVGTAGLARMAALILAALCALFWSRQPLASAIGAVMASGAALGSLAWGGHGAMDEGTAGWVHLGADIVHLLTAGLWLGALAALLHLALRHTPSDLTHLRQLHAALQRFSAVGIAVVVLLLLSGIANSLFLAGPAPLGAILSSSWSHLMAVKLALFAAMLLLAAVNRFRLTPALAGAPDAQTMRRLRISLTLETCAAVLILLLVAWLGTLEPPVSTI